MESRMVDTHLGYQVSSEIPVVFLTPGLTA